MSLYSFEKGISVYVEMIGVREKKFDDFGSVAYGLMGF
jgi:hypothetical protein